MIQQAYDVDKCLREIDACVKQARDARAKRDTETLVGCADEIESWASALRDAAERGD